MGPLPIRADESSLDIGLEGHSVLLLETSPICLWKMSDNN